MDRRVAYFCMEFGLGEALPLYAGGLGVLAGDHLKTASDLGVPLVGIGLLYQEGYFRQMTDGAGWQHEVFTYNDPASMPLRPVRAADGGWLHAALAFPGRTVRLRLWEARVGRVMVYLLDSNDPLNSPVDRGITGKLYDVGSDMRLLQEFVLGIGGWRALEALGLEVDVCHLNEGHAAFAVIERARSFMLRHGVSFEDALWATRAGNVFTTHTPVAAGFDRFERSLVEQYMPYLRDYVTQLGVGLDDILALGRLRPDDATEPFNMAYLAIRGSIATNAVSALHGAVSRRLFAGLFPRWPEAEVPVTHVTNGVHVPTWDSPQADRLWEETCGKACWSGPLESLGAAIAQVPDERLWACRAEARRFLVHVVRSRLARQLGFRGAEATVITRAAHVFDPNALTLGFARRFATYKRPTLLLRDRDRLVRLLMDDARPVQLVVAGKAHPADAEGKALIREWAQLARDPAVRERVVFLEDYDITLAQELVRGVDVWINTPRRPWEASGTSGMKVLVNGGLNLSERDGWWAEAWEPGVGWAIGDGGTHEDEAAWDDLEAEQLYTILEREIVPAFYGRDADGLPRAWIARMRASMAQLAPRFSTGRMMREYVESLYLPATALVRQRVADGGRPARELREWAARLTAAWPSVRFGAVRVEGEGGQWCFTAQVYLGDAEPGDVSVELFANAPDGTGAPFRVEMARVHELPGTTNAALYQAAVAADRPAGDFTPRVVPRHPDVRVPLELPLVTWQR